MKKILSIIFLLFVLNISAQSGWSSGNYYAYRGQESITCGSQYSTYDNFGNYSGTYQNCRKLVWEQRRYSGNIYYWGPQGWYAQWYSGYSWYCYWYDFARWCGY